MEQVQGFECSRCKCKRATVVTQWRSQCVRRELVAGQVERRKFFACWRRQRCDHCGQVQAVRYQDIDIESGEVSPRFFFIITCPACGYDETPVSKTGAGGVRYHKCRKCLHTFKSIERRS